MNINDEQQQRCSSNNSRMITARCNLSQTKYTGELIINDTQCNEGNKSKGGFPDDQNNLLTISKVNIYMHIFLNSNCNDQCSRPRIIIKN
jgi:hypothetical protein